MVPAKKTADCLEMVAKCRWKSAWFALEGPRLGDGNAELATCVRVWFSASPTGMTEFYGIYLCVPVNFRGRNPELHQDLAGTDIHRNRSWALSDLNRLARFGDCDFLSDGFEFSFGKYHARD